MPLLPVMTLASLFPVPLILPLPVSVRSSTFAPSVKLADDCTVSVPPLSASVTTSPAFSTTYIAVVADPAGHGVDAGAAVERVVARTARDVVDAVAAVDDEVARCARM